MCLSFRHGMCGQMRWWPSRRCLIVESSPLRYAVIYIYVLFPHLKNMVSFVCSHSLLILALFTEMARHNKGGEIPAENTTPEQHRVQRMLPTRAHCLGKLTMLYDIIHWLIKRWKKIIINSHNTLFIWLQLVMEYCLGSASDLLEGELSILWTPRLCMRLHDYKQRLLINVVFVYISVGEFIPFQFTRNLCKKLK